LPFQPHKKREKEDKKVVSHKLGVHTLAEFRAVSGEKLLELFGMPEWKGGHDFGPDIDGYFLPESAPAIFAAGKQNDVALLAGWNHDEDSSEIASDPKKQTAESLKATAKKDFGGEASEFLRLYPSGTPEQTLRSAEDYAGDHFIAWSTWEWMEAQSKTGKRPIYRYRFDLALPSDGKEPSPGASHSAEIEYVFGQLDSKAGMNWRPEDRQLSELMQKYWSNFAKNGDPNGPDLPKWPGYSSSGGWPVMFLGGQSAVHKDDLRPRYLFLQSQWAK
jgi:para-nitrobenzyl esterase